MRSRGIEDEMSRAFVLCTTQCVSSDLPWLVVQAATGRERGEGQVRLWDPFDYRSTMKADAVAVTDTGYAPVIVEMKRGGSRGKPHRVDLRAGLDVGPTDNDAHAHEWWGSLEDSARKLLIEACYQPHAVCDDLPCGDWEHQWVNGDPNKIIVGMAQPPAYLFCKWMPDDYRTDDRSILVLLGGDDSDPITYYGSTLTVFGGNSDRFVQTSHATFLDHLAVLTANLPLAPADRTLLRKVAMLMWADARGPERRQFTEPARRLMK